MLNITWTKNTQKLINDEFSTFFFYYPHHANIKYLPYKHIYDQETRLLMKNLRSTKICKCSIYSLPRTDLFRLESRYANKRNLWNCRSCSNPPNMSTKYLRLFCNFYYSFLQLIQTRRIFVADRGYTMIIRVHKILYWKILQICTTLRSYKLVFIYI